MIWYLSGKIKLADMPAFVTDKRAVSVDIISLL